MERCLCSSLGNEHALQKSPGGFDAFSYFHSLNQEDLCKEFLKYNTSESYSQVSSVISTCSLNALYFLNSITMPDSVSEMDIAIHETYDIYIQLNIC